MRCCERAKDAESALRLLPPELPWGHIAPMLLSLLLAYTVILGDTFAALLTTNCTTPMEFAVAARHHFCSLFLHSQPTVST